MIHTNNDVDNGNNLILVCKHCNLTSIQVIGARRRTICPHCGNFYHQTVNSTNGIAIQINGNLSCSDVNSCGLNNLSSSNRSPSINEDIRIFSLPSITKRNHERSPSSPPPTSSKAPTTSTSGPLKSFSNFLRRLGPKEKSTKIQRRHNASNESFPNCPAPLSPSSRVNSTSCSLLPPILQENMTTTDNSAKLGGHSLSPRYNSNLRMVQSIGDLNPGELCAHEGRQQYLENVLRKSAKDLEKEITESRQTKCWTDVRNYFAIVFDNSANLNAAFKWQKNEDDNDDDDEQEMKPRLEINFKKIYDVFNLLTTLPSEVQKVTLKAILNNLLRDRRLQSKDEIRTYVILLLNPQFNHKTTYTIFAHLLRQVSVLKDMQHHYLVHTFKNISPVKFKEIVQRVQRFISARLASNSTKDDDLPPKSKCQWWIPSATKILALLNASSNLTSPQLMSYQEFYNPSLDNLDLLAEYYNWQCSNGPNCFSFCQYPFILSLTAKRTILQKDSEQQMVVMARKSLVAKVQQHQMPEIGMLFLNLTIRRSHLVSDSLNEIARKQTELKKKLKVTFAGEPGLDMGGLTKEWFLLLTRQIFQADFGMFTYDPSSRVHWFSSAPCDNLQEFNLVGALMGLAVYNSVIFDIRFPPIVYKKLLSPAVVPPNIQKAVVGVIKASLTDLKLVHPDLANGLQELLNYDGNVEEDMGVTFQISYNVLGTLATHDLKPDGNNIAVTNDNREEYVQLYIDYLLNDSIYRQFQAFYHGFHSVCASNALILLRPEEIELLVCGSPTLDMNELIKVVIYDGYNAESETIRYFWEVVTSLGSDVQKQLLLFTTGSDRIPVGGMQEMHFKITRVENVNMLPVSHTCFNQLVLPAYKSKKVLKQKLLVAIQNAEGFGLE